MVKWKMNERYHPVMSGWKVRRWKLRRRRAQNVHRRTSFSGCRRTTTIIVSKTAGRGSRCPSRRGACRRRRARNGASAAVTTTSSPKSTSSSSTITNATASRALGGICPRNDLPRLRLGSFVGRATTVCLLWPEGTSLPSGCYWSFLLTRCVRLVNGPRNSLSNDLMRLPFGKFQNERHLFFYLLLWWGKKKG